MADHWITIKARKAEEQLREELEQLDPSSLAFTLVESFLRKSTARQKARVYDREDPY